MQEICSCEERFPESPEEYLWDIGDLMHYFKVSESRARKLYLEDGLPVVKLSTKEYRFIPRSVQRWAEEHEQILKAS